VGKTEVEVNDPVRHYWQIRLQEIKARLNSNNIVARGGCGFEVILITEKSFPKGRIKVVLINEDLGI
jgi:hypothetical protein